MRIISDFRDYYDCMQSTDEEKQAPLWLRNPKEVRYEDNREGLSYPFPTMVPSYRLRMTPGVTQHIVGFCGRIYPFLELQDPEGPWPYKSVLCPDMAAVDEFVRTNLRPEYAEAFFAKKWLARHHKMAWSVKQRKHFVQFFEECEAKRDAFRGLFEENRCPVLVGKYPVYEPDSRPGYGDHVTGVITLNASLRRFAWARVFPPAQAYQEISMFMNNLAVPIKPIPELDDKTMAEAKGFDRFSFRKDPSKRRGKGAGVRR